MRERKSAYMSVCKMERHGRERREREERAFLQRLTTESDDMEVPPIYLTAFQYLL